jgi:hypothetical protein
MTRLPSWIEAVAAFLPPPFQRVATTSGPHPHPKSMRLRPPSPIRLESPLQGLILIRNSFRLAIF